MKQILSISAFCFLLSALSLQAQFNFQDIAFSSVNVPPTTPPWSWSPTNNSDGTYPLAWYVSTDYYTNTYVFLPDRTTNSWTLTNQAAASKWPYWSGNQNGSAPLFFDGVLGSRTNYLRSLNFTSSQPSEVIMVMKVVLSTGGERDFWGSGSVGQILSVSTSAKNGFYAGALVSAANDIVTNVFTVFDYIIRGASSDAKTNNVINMSGNVSTTRADGMTVGARSTEQQPASFYLLEMIIYGTGNKSVGTGIVPGTNTTWSSNIFAYITNKYNL